MQRFPFHSNAQRGCLKSSVRGHLSQGKQGLRVVILKLFNQRHPEPEITSKKKKRKTKESQNNSTLSAPREINWLYESLALHLSARMTGDRSACIQEKLGEF